MTPRALRGRDHLIGAALCVAYVLLLVGDGSGPRDVSRRELLRPRGEELRSLDHAAFQRPAAAFERESIDRAWSYNWEHPAWMKLSFAWSWLAQKHLGLFPSESLAFRFPGMLTAGLLLWLIYAWGASVMRREGALFAALAFA